MFKKVIVFLMLAGLFLSGCSSENVDSYVESESQYGIVYTSYINNESKIIFYSETGKKVNEITLQVGGIQSGQKYSDKIYFPVLGTSSKPDDRILVLDIKQGKTDYVDTDKLPIDLYVQDGYLYVIHNTSIDYGILTKIDIEKNEIQNQLKLDGVLRKLTVTNNLVYVIADNPQKKEQTIYKLSNDLVKKEIIINQYTAFPTDMLVIDNKLIIANVAKNDFSGPTDQYIEIDMLTNEIKLNKLESYAPNKIYTLDGKVLITHYNPPANTGNVVTVIDNLTNSQESYTLKNTLYLTEIADNKFFAVDGTQLYKYDLETLNLQQTYKLVKYEDKVISDFFIIK